MDYTDPTYLEAVYAALFARLQTAVFPGAIALNKRARMVLVPDEVAVADQPALILVQGPMHAEQKELFGPTKWTLTALAVVYFRADVSTVSPSPLPATLANYMVWGLANALGTLPPYQKQTLGGLVEHCWIEGAVSVEVVSEQVVITVPIYLLAGPVG